MKRPMSDLEKLGALAAIVKHRMLEQPEETCHLVTDVFEPRDPKPYAPCRHTAGAVRRHILRGFQPRWRVQR